MTIRNWLWIAAGLAAFAVLTFVWATDPHNCTPPNEQGRITCQR